MGLFWNFSVLARNILLLSALLWITGHYGFVWFFFIHLWFVDMDEERVNVTFEEFYEQRIENYVLDEQATAHDTWILEQQVNRYTRDTSDILYNFDQKTKTQVNAEASESGEFGSEFEDENTARTEYTELLDYITAQCVYDWTHVNGLVIPENDTSIHSVPIYYNYYQQREYSNYLNMCAPVLTHAALMYCDYTHIRPYTYKNKTVKSLKLNNKRKQLWMNNWKKFSHLYKIGKTNKTARTIKPAVKRYMNANNIYTSRNYTLQVFDSLSLRTVETFTYYTMINKSAAYIYKQNLKRVYNVHLLAKNDF